MSASSRRSFGGPRRQGIELCHEMPLGESCGGLRKLHYLGRALFFAVILNSTMLPLEATRVLLFLIVKRLEWTNT